MEYSPAPIKWFVFALFLSVSTLAQTDELRQATGLPIQIGQPVIYGKVTISRLAKTAKRPVIQVVLMEGGTQAGRSQTNDSGYYYFLSQPRGSVTLIFEINGSEVGRVVVITADSASRTIRQDFELNWEEFQRQAPPGVISAKDAYPRDPDAAKLFDAAMQSVKEKKYDKAVSQFNDVLSKDPKDFVSWTELGTVFFKKDELDNAEACYFKAIELKKDFTVALLNLGKLYFSRKQYENAILVLSSAVKSDQNSSDAHFYLGECYLQVKKGNQAAFHFNEALRLAPVDKAEARLRLASLYNAAGMKDKAVVEYRAFLEVVKDHPDRAKIEQYIKDNSK